ncbi:hypothetical protein QQF64_013867 [Cirrhinus molitorella]|uniref:Uncharacterized protein n=1 Tax=Cirrhinus molitorella TaxID=172907 RepID=A0ABR3LUX9_9TELE
MRGAGTACGSVGTREQLDTARSCQAPARPSKNPSQPSQNRSFIHSEKRCNLFSSGMCSVLLSHSTFAGLCSLSGCLGSQTAQDLPLRIPRSRSWFLRDVLASSG